MSANKIVFIGALLLTFSISFSSAKFSSDVEACKPGDEECLIEAINKVIETKHRGDDEMNLLSIDPLDVGVLEMKRSPDNPVNIEIVLRNSFILGYKDLRAVRVSGFGQNPEGKHEVYFQGPSASLVGDYTIDGNVIILPIKGEGQTNLTLESFFIKLVIIGGSKIKDDQTFLDVKKIRLDFNTTRMHINFSNLFNGDKTLGETTNTFLNDNWSDIFVELKTAFTDSVEGVAANIIRTVFEAHPYNELLNFEK